MYKIRPKRTMSFLGFLLVFLLLAAVGLGIGYAGAKLKEQATRQEYFENLPEEETENLEKAQKELAESEAASKSGVDDAAGGEETHVPAEEFMYYIQLDGTQTKVFSLQGDEKIFSHTLPVEPASLPDDDLAMLRSGLFLKSRDELLSFTEDFCS